MTQIEADPTLAKDWQIVPSLKTTSGRLRWNYFRDDGTRFGTPKSVAALSSPTLVVVPLRLPSATTVRTSRPRCTAIRGLPT